MEMTDTPGSEAPGSATASPTPGSAGGGDNGGAATGSAALLPEDPEDMRCYCGLERDLNVPEFQCGMCLRFYHVQCIKCPVGECVPMMTNYQFFCKRCSVSESFNKRPAMFTQMCLTALAVISNENQERTFFSKDKEIIPFIEANWENLTTGPRKVKQTWHNTIGKMMMKDPAIFQWREEPSGETTYGLMNLDLTKIGPNCESLFRLTNANYRNTEIQRTTAGDSKRGSTKRKGPSEGPIVKHKRSEVSTRMAPKSYPQEHPYNKDGYRYILAEPDPHAPNWQAYDESVEWAGKPIPPYLYRTYLEGAVMLAMHDRAPQLKISDDRLTVTGEKGYSMIRATHGVNYGTWYFEVKIDDMPDGAATRIGWSQKLGNLQAPCGYDKFSYSWRSRKGTVFHQSRGKHYSEGGYRAGDVVGVLISLPYTPNTKLLPDVYKDKPLVKFKSLLYYEEKDNVTETEKALKHAKTSQIMMFRNGKPQGVAFTDVFAGTYYPAISLYKSSVVTANFGPKFKYPPKVQEKFRPISDVIEESYVKHAMGDILYHIENEGQLPEF